MKKSKKKQEYFILFFIILLSIFLRVWNITKSGSPWDNDEIAHILTSMDIFSSTHVPFPRVGHIGRAMSLPAVLFSRNINVTLPISRLIRVFFGVGTIFLVYLFTKKFYNEKNALVSTFLMSVFSSHVFLSRIAIQASPALFFCMLFLYLFHEFCINKKEKILYLSLISAGLAFSTHMASIVFFIAVSISYLWILKPNISRKLLIKSILILLFLSYPIFYGILDVVSPQMFQSSDGVSLLNVGQNIFKGIFVNLPAFFGGNVGPVADAMSSIAYPLYPILLFFFVIICIKNYNKKCIFLIFSISISIVLVSILHLPPLHKNSYKPLTFYIIIPFISIISGRTIIYLDKKMGIIFSFIVVLFIIFELFFIIRSITVPSEYYDFCDKEILEKITDLNYDSAVYYDFPSFLRHPFNYRIFEHKINIKSYGVEHEDFMGNRSVFNEDSIFIFVSGSWDPILDEDEVFNMIGNLNFHTISFRSVSSEPLVSPTIRTMNISLLSIENVTCNPGEPSEIVYYFYETI